jgi:hypothetical protein
MTGNAAIVPEFVRFDRSHIRLTILDPSDLETQLVTITPNSFNGRVLGDHWREYDFGESLAVGFGLEWSTGEDCEKRCLFLIDEDCLVVKEPQFLKTSLTRSQFEGLSFLMKLYFRVWVGPIKSDRCSLLEELLGTKPMRPAWTEDGPAFYLDMNSLTGETERRYLRQQLVSKEIFVQFPALRSFSEPDKL